MNKDNTQAILNLDFNGKSVRVIPDHEGRTLFSARDVARSLGFSNPTQATKTHCKQAIQNLEVLAYRGNAVNLIPQSDVYRLVMRSRLPTAVEFQDWVCEVVIPSIRNHGGYVNGMEKLPESQQEAISKSLGAMAMSVQESLENGVWKALERETDKAAMGRKPMTESQRKAYAIYRFECLYDDLSQQLKDQLKELTIDNVIDRTIG
ncbi:hypothetical protein HYO13_11100 [Vibrio parahaemolyticus]|nr:hypothetical protein [Vibrio parahaemolyticus]